MKNNDLKNKFERVALVYIFADYLMSTLTEDTWIHICFCIQSVFHSVVLIEAYEENVASHRYVVAKVF